MKINVYNHQYLNDDHSWIYIYLDQLKQMEDFGLMDAADVVKVTALGQQEQINLLKDISKSYPKIVVYEIPNNATSHDVATTFAAGNDVGAEKFVSETPTIRRLWEDAKTSTFYALYFHGKGASAFPKHFKTGNVDTFRNYYYWRKYLEWGVLESWEKCVNALNEYEVAGCNYNNHPFPHYSGNFWWARSDYIRKLDDVANSAWWRSVKSPSTPNRLVDEMWPCHMATKLFVLDQVPYRLQSPNPGLYSESYLRKQYVRENS
jgi:hypothetical protein